MAVVDSGVGSLGYAGALRALRPDLEIILSLDPDHMPYGPRSPEEVRSLVLATSRAAMELEPDAIVVACNTASVHGLDVLRKEFEPHVPVIGTVPAIRPAAATGGPVAVWATAATTASDYLRGLVDAFAADIETHAVAAHGLAEAIEAADIDAVDQTIAEAVEQTPHDVRALVLGCTHYGLVEDRIAAALAASGVAVTIFDSPDAVARQTLRRIGLEPVDPLSGEQPAPAGPATVLLSGRRGELPAQLLAYAPGARLLGPAGPSQNGQRSAGQPVQRQPAQRHTPTG